MNRPKTHIVQSRYVARDGKPRVYVKDHPQPLLCDETVQEGDAVVIQGSRAERPQ